MLATCWLPVVVPWGVEYSPQCYIPQEVQNVWAAARRRRRLAHKTFEAADYELYDSKASHAVAHVK